VTTGDGDFPPAEQPDIDEAAVSDEAGGDGAPIQGTSQITGFVTYTGAGFAVVRAAPERGEHPEPRPASRRRYLRGSLPAIYQEQEFAMSFVAAFERVLDPIVALLDGMHAHFDPDLAPLDILDLETRWLGLQINEAQPASELRRLVRRAAELGRLRGTTAGLALALELNFPELPLRVEDGGGVAWAASGELPAPKPPAFVVYCDKPISREEAASVARVIEAVKPAHVGFRLRVKGPKKEAEAPTA
jgi:phage tail-like protein